jgi:hypothetical protein
VTKGSLTPCPPRKPFVTTGVAENCRNEHPAELKPPPFPPFRTHLIPELGQHDIAMFTHHKPCARSSSILRAEAQLWNSKKPSPPSVLSPTV